MGDRRVTVVCEGRAFRGPPRAPTVAAMAPNLPGETPETPDDPEVYVGLTQEAAEERARHRGWSTVRAVPPGAMLTMEYLVGRINFEVEDGAVVRSWRG